jgi:glycosyltransferase involved in cell wall biosynthesis
VPTYRYVSRLAVTVRAILADPGTTEVFVVVDGCRDGSLELLEALAEKDIRLVPIFVEHLGKSGAQAVALDRATSDVVLLLDQDVVAGPGLVSGHARHHLSGEHLVILGYMPTVSRETETSVTVLTHLYASEYEAHCRAYEAQPELVLKRMWGGNVSMRRDDCRRVGLAFRYFGHEDQNFGICCLKAGLVGVFDRTLYAEHHHSRDASEFLWYSKMNGASRWEIHSQHSDVLGPYEPFPGLEGLPAFVRVTVKLLSQKRFGDHFAALFATLGEVLARAGWRDGESIAYRLARQIEERTGAVLAMAGRDDELKRRVKPLFQRRRRVSLT